MKEDYLHILKTFDTNSIPNLDVAVRGALERLSQDELPVLDTTMFGDRPLVVGSGSASATGKILFRDTQALYADESQFEERLATYIDRDSVVIVSASGGKHAVGIAEALKDSNLPVWLLTNNADAPAAAHLEPERVVVFPKNREPYTYNTSTYLSMILSGSGEGVARVSAHLDTVEPLLPENLGLYNAYLITLPVEFEGLRPMLRTKFDELFGGKLCGRVFTIEEVKHAKTIVPSETELFIHFGDGAELFPEKKEQFSIPLSDVSGYGGMLALGYFVIGKIQAAHPPYFKEHIGAYVKRASGVFNQEINVIVE